MNDDETMVSGAVKVSTFRFSYEFSSGSRQKVSGKNALVIDKNLETPIEFIKSCASSNLFWNNPRIHFVVVVDVVAVVVGQGPFKLYSLIFFHQSIQWHLNFKKMSQHDPFLHGETFSYGCVDSLSSFLLLMAQKSCYHLRLAAKKHYLQGVVHLIWWWPDFSPQLKANQPTPPSKPTRWFPFIRPDQIYCTR